MGLDNLAIEWLANTNTVLPSISVAILWFTLGYYLVIYTAGLTNIPRELYECAEIEGANGIQRLLKITLPMLVPSIKINVILSTIGAVAVFEIPKAMTNGGPGYYSQTVGLQVFSYAFGLRLPGRALALAVIMVIITLIITAFEWFYFKGKEDIQ